MKHRFAFIAFLSLLLSIPFLFSGCGKSSEEDKEKKVLYFHVGEPKTGTKAIQYECSERREELAKLGVYYPPSQNNKNHEVEINKLLEDKVEEAKEWILNVKHQSQASQSILLSTELAALIPNDARFCDFLAFLNQHFLVKYIYCVRKTIPAIGSNLTMNFILSGDTIINDALNIDELIKAHIRARIFSHDFYSRLNTTFLSYEDLAKSGKLVQTFFEQAMGLKMEIPNKSINTMGDYDGCVMKLTDTQLAHLERAFSVKEGFFDAAYRAPDRALKLSKVLSALIRTRTEKILSNPIFHMGEFYPYLSSGFSALEGSHRWTEGTKASITVPLAEMERRPARVSFLNTSGLVTDNHSQDLTVKVNGKEVGRYVYTSSNNNQTIDIPLPKADQAKIEFEIPHAASPFDLGTGDDKRTLGILFDEVHFQF
ncbi:MAG: hypothetical protein K2X02_04115 [Alphaproteobacteria bacterium]|nr:hypothetical protein [Alphaproteobacteria bacterium]